MEDFSSYLKRINNCEPNDSLLSETRLGLRLEQIPLALLSHAHLSGLTQALNLQQVIPNSSGLPRDFRGMAELMEFSSIEVKTKFERASNPTQTLIGAFITKERYANLNTLIKMVEKIERFDLLDDILPILIELAEVEFRQQPHLLNFRCQQPAIENNESKNDQTILASNGTPPDLVSDLNPLTFDDDACSIIHYDAFICFAPEDYHYAQELIDSLVKRGAKVATADDLRPGHFEHEALMRLIDVRCRKVIIILTPNFSKSKECEFQTKFASEVGFKTRVTKIIPVLYESLDDSTLPRMIQFSTKIDMNSGQRQWQFERLIRALELNQSSQYTKYYPENSKPKLRDTEGSQSPVKAITFSDTNSTTSNISNEPIVDVLHSEDLSNSTLRSKEIDASETFFRKNPSPTSSHSSGPKTWLVESFRKIFKHPSSTTSQTGLLVASRDLSSEDGHQNSEV